MKKLSSHGLAMLLIAGFATTSSATITLQMSVPFTGSVATNFANAAGVATNGMDWGVVVDTGGTSGVFAMGSYLPFSITTPGFLSTASGLTDDYYFPAPISARTTNGAGLTELGGGNAGVNGTIGTIANVPFGGSTNIAQNQKFGLIWFSTNSASTVGAKYGFFADAALTVPADSQTVDRSAPFAGTDPVRTASFSIVPEPSALTLLAVSSVLFVRRRFRR